MSSLLNAIDMRLNLAEIVVTGEGADMLVEAALALPYVNRAVIRRIVGRGAAGHASRAGKSEGGVRTGGFHLRRRNLFAAGHRAAQIDACRTMWRAQLSIRLKPQHPPPRLTVMGAASSNPCHRTHDKAT